MVSAAAMTLLLAQATHSVASVGAVLIARAMPALLFGMHAGVLADRLDRKTSMVLADLSRAVMTLAIPVLAAAGLLLPWVLPVVFLMSCATVIFNPMRTSVIPELVQQEDLLAANAFLTTSERFTEIAGYALGGMLVVALGYSWPFYIDALTFLASGLLISTMTIPRALERMRLTGDALWRDVGDALRRVRHEGALASVLSLALAVVIPGSIVVPVVVFLALRTYSAGPAGYVAFEIAIALGLALGAAALSLRREPRGGRTMVLGLIGTGVFWVITGVTHSFGLALFTLFASSFFQVQYMIANITSLQKMASAGFRGRVFGLRQAMVQGGMMAGMALSGWLGATLAPPVIFSGVGMVVTAIGAGAFLVPALRRAP
jgi:hypothetical protein